MNKTNEQLLVEALRSQQASDLKSAAPDLLAVAELARDFIENIQFNDYLTEHEQALLDSALAAIAKAKGVK